MVANPFWSNSIVFNENRITSIIAAVMLTLGINGPLVFILLVSKILILMSCHNKFIFVLNFQVSF